MQSESRAQSSRLGSKSERCYALRGFLVLCVAAPTLECSQRADDADPRLTFGSEMG